MAATLHNKSSTEKAKISSFCFSHVGNSIVVGGNSIVVVVVAVLRNNKSSCEESAVDVEQIMNHFPA